jgi:MFS family permease
MPIEVTRADTGNNPLPVEKRGLTFSQWLVLAACFLGWMFDGVEMGLFPQVVRPALNSMGVKDDSQVGVYNGYIMAAFLLGAATGGLIFGWLGDKIGRVRSMVISITVYSLLTGACALAQAPWHLGALCFLAALGMGGEWALAVSLVMECWPEKHRPKLAGAIGAASNFGFLFIALVAMCWRPTSESWRWIMLVGAMPAVLALLVSLFVPESERWKESVKRGASKPLREIFSRKLLKSTLLAIVFASVPLIGTWAAVSGWTPTWVDQMKQMELAKAELAKRNLSPDQRQSVERAQTPDQRKKAVQDILSPEQGKPSPIWKKINEEASGCKGRVQVFLALGAITGCFIAPVLGGIWGRRPVYFGLCVSSLVVCQYLYRCHDAFNAEFMIVAFFAGGATAAFYGWLPLYLPEIFPTRVRATGQGLSFNFGRVLASAAAVRMGQIVGLFGGNYARAGATVTLIYLVGMVVIWFAPETKGKPLPE